MPALTSSDLEPFLRIPPFPGSVRVALASPAPVQGDISDRKLDEAMEVLALERVGGAYWGAQPPLPPSPFIFVRSRAESPPKDVRDALSSGRTIVGSLNKPVHWLEAGQQIKKIIGECDPWHLVSRASVVMADADDELILIAALAGVPIVAIGEGRFSGVATDRSGLREAVRNYVVGSGGFVNPFSGDTINVVEAARLCGFWRRLIDSNRSFAGALGFAGWKRRTVAPLLWSGGRETIFDKRAEEGSADAEVVVWKSRTAPTALEELQRRHARIVEAEDGFIRSIGLGADCVPPLSLVVDRKGIYFDPGQPSDLENLLERGQFTLDDIDRARRLRALIVEHGVSKYGVGQRVLRRRTDQAHVLVTGQVEDDRSVQCGGGVVATNFELLKRARLRAPGAYLIYKPHPDVEAGHRVGAIADATALNYANEIVRDQSISSLIDLVDEVHVNTSLAGFEALVRGKAVTTHGVPFYAGWGQTRDLGDVPARRSTKRTIDELVAAVLLHYPRYLDPLTGLPCTPETLVHRLAQGAVAPQGMLVRLRQIQGNWRRRFAASRGASR